MNLQYINGFFDADGSITLSRKHTNENKSLRISFHNTQREILEQIYTFLLDKHNLKGYITKKTPKVDNHSDSYDLNYSFKSAIELANLLKSFHPKKIHRLNTIIKYYNSVTSKNGKYSEKQLSRKLAFERLFFIH